MARVLVTGATGFIGGRVVARLLARGDEVVAAGRRRTDELSEAGVDQRVVDLADELALREVAAGVDGVVHAAAAFGDDLATARRVNRDGTRALAEAAFTAGVRGFVHVSTTSVYDRHAVGNGEVGEDAPLLAEPEDRAASSAPVYGLTKAEGERELTDVAARGLPVVILRPPAVLGSGPTSTWGSRVPAAFRDGRLSARPPESTFAWVHVEDLVDAVLAALERPRPITCNVVGGHTTYGEYLAALRTFVPEAPATAAVTDEEPWRGRYATDALPRALDVTPYRSFAAAMQEIADDWA